MKPINNILTHLLPVLPKYPKISINSDSLRKICFDLFLWTIFLVSSTIFTFYCFSFPKYQILGGILLFQCNLVLYGFGYLRVVQYLVKILRAELAVQLISTSFISQLLFFVLNLRDDRIVERQLISFIVFSIFLAYCINQLPSRQRRILFYKRTTLGVLTNCWIISSVCYLNLFYIQGLHIVLPKPSETKDLDFNVSEEEKTTNWILYDSSYMFKMFILVFAQTFAYHVSYIESRQSLINPRKPRCPRYG